VSEDVEPRTVAKLALAVRLCNYSANKLVLLKPTKNNIKEKCFKKKVIL
jgi:hypothetical protein